MRDGGIQAIYKMKQCIAPGPTGIVAKKLKASVVVIIPLLCDIANAIIAERVTPGDRHMYYTINLYKGKGDALERGSYRGLKVTEHGLR